MRKYWGAELTESGIEKPEFFIIVGEMSDGTKVYEKLENSNGTQFLRYTKYGMQVFVSM